MKSESKNLAKLVLSLGVLGATFGSGYFLGKYYNEPIRVVNLNVDRNGPKYLCIMNRKIMGDSYFSENSNGSFEKER